MTNRYHFPVVVTTDDDTTREEAAQYVERVLANLEETDFIYRTYIEQDSLNDGDAERMLDMMERLDDSELASAVEALDEITEDENT